MAAGASTVIFAPASKTENNTEPTGQSDGTPIMTVTNIGNTALNMSCNLTEAKPAWAIIKVSDEYNNYTADTFDIVRQEFNSSVAIGDQTKMYMWTNVSEAVAGDGGDGGDATHNRTLRIYSDAVA